MRIRHVLSLLALASAAVSCGGDASKSSPGETQPTTLVVTTVIVAPPFAQLELGSSATFTVEVHDQLGALMSGKVAAWTSGDPRVATVDASGVVKSIAVGTASVIATVEGKSGLATITVVPVAVASVSIAAPARSVTAGLTATYTATTKDRNGNVLAGRVVAWTSSSTRVATIDGNGVPTAISAGTTTITATSETISATLSVVVAAPAGSVPPTIASIAPATLTRGATATITGANFGATPGLNQVFISGVATQVTAASPTQLTVTVPAGVPCQVTQSVNVDVLTVAGSTTAKQTLQVAAQRSLAVGASFFMTATGNLACNELPPGGTYLVSVFNAGKAVGSVAGFELKGIGGAPAGNMAAPVSPNATVIPAPRMSVQSAVTPEAQAAENEHLQHLQGDLDLVRRLGSPRRYPIARSIAGVANTQSQLVVPTTVGATTSINYHFNSCRISSATTITARVVYVGPKAIVLEDNASPLAGKIDADLSALAKEFEDVSFPLLGSFGNVLAYDDSTNKNGHLIMLFTPQVNNQSANLLGFVSACDFYPPSIDPSVSASNQAEIFYARAVTDTSPTSNSINGRPLWRREMPGTLIHESKHILAFGERFQTPVIITAFEQIWLEEATAQQASELYGRAIHGNGWKTNAGYQDALFCEVRPSSASCNGATFVMGNHFGFLNDYLQNFETKSILSGVDDYDIYGSSWLFARWLTDTYAAGNESAFLQSVVKNYNVTGVDNVVSVTGKTWPELLSQFTLMLLADDLPNVPKQFQELSWNLPAVFAGYNGDFPSSRSLSPLAPRQAPFATNFTASLSSIKGGGAMLLRINASGNVGSQLLDLHDFSGQPLDPTSNIGIAVLRIQ